LPPVYQGIVTAQPTALHPTPQLVVIGDFNIDVILGEVESLPRVGYDTVSPEYAIEPGGSAAIVALGLAKVGWETDLYANVGNDLFGHYLRDTARDSNLRLMNCADDRSESTGLSVAFSKHGDRGFVSVPNPESGWNALTKMLEAPPKHVHVCYQPYLPGLNGPLADLFKNLRRMGCTLSLDPAGPGPNPIDPLEALDALGRVDFLFLNEQECGDLGLKDPPLDSYFDRLADTILIKRGNRGAGAFQPNVSMEIAERSVEALETTGAGDNFAVGFLTSWHRLKHLEKAVRAGNLFGSESTRYAGGVQAQDNFKALMIDYPDLF